METPENKIDLKIERQKFLMKKKGMEDISSSVKDVSESIEKLAESLSPKEIGDGASFIVKGLKGDTPVKGKDYLTDKEMISIKTELTPIKGVDYKDGIKGVDGKNPMYIGKTAPLNPKIGDLWTKI